MDRQWTGDHWAQAPGSPASQRVSVDAQATDSDGSLRTATPPRPPSGSSSQGEATTNASSLSRASPPLPLSGASSQVPGLMQSVSVLTEAMRRVAALALVDAKLAVPQSKSLCDVALGALALRPSTGGEFVYYRPSHRPSVLLVLCHPSGGPSLCRSLADVWEEELRAAGLEVNKVELGGPERLSLESGEELQAALTGRDTNAAVSARVRELQGLLEESRFLVFVHPIFWFDVPSQLKGFQESVLSSGFAFRKLPGHWLLNRAAGVVERVPVVRTLMRRYAAYGMLRDKRVFVTRTQGGPSAGMGIFGHEATSLESSLQFCGARLADVHTVAEVDDTSAEDLKSRVLPAARRRIQVHCRAVQGLAAAAAEAGAK